MKRRAAAAAAPDWTPAEQAVFDGFGHPWDVQVFLDQTPYSADPIYRSPRSVLRDRKAHCFDGALFAAAALERLGCPPRIVDLRAQRDDDHVLAVFQVDRHWGAVAKSNCTGLRWREPIHRSIRELTISYFDDYYNLDSERALREYSRPVDLRRYDAVGWRTSDERLEVIATALDRVKHWPIATPAMIARFRKVDDRSYRAGLLDSDWAGLYKPGGEKG